MALALLGGGIVDIRGSVSGNTFSRCKYGTTSRGKTSPIQPRTLHQRNTRGLLSLVSNRWSQVLSEAERSQWNAFALTQPQTNRFGQTAYLSGQQWHNKLNFTANALTGSNFIATPPPSGTYPPLVALSITAGSAAGGTMSITYAGTPLVGTPYVMIYVTQCLPAGTSYVSSKLKLIGAQASLDGAHSIISLWKARYGNYAPIAGMKVFALVKEANNDDGTSSVPLIASTIVT